MTFTSKSGIEAEATAFEWLEALCWTTTHGPDIVPDAPGAGRAELAKWAAAQGDAFFLPADDAVAPALRTVGDWASGHGYRPAAIATFLQVADYLLAAHALAHECIVVTREAPADTTSKIRIPNACIGIGLCCMSPYEMLGREQARFVLRAGREAA